MDGFRVDELDHVELFVPDRNEAAQWYERVLGLAIASEYASWAADPDGPLMLTTARAGTKLALFTGEPPRGQPTVGFHLVAFRVSQAGFESFLRHIQNHPVFDDHGQEVRELAVRDHGAAWSVYFRDPYGYRLEVTTYDPAPATGPGSVAGKAEPAVAPDRSGQ